jgi:WD40 repeat protein
VALSPDGRIVVSASPDGTVRRWDVERPQEPQVICQLSGAFDTVLRFSPDSRAFVACSHDLRAGILDSLKLLDAATGKKRWEANQPALACAFSPDSKLLGWLSGDGVVRLYDAGSGKEVRQFDNVGWGWGMDFSPDGKLLAVATQYTKCVKIWNVETGALVHSWVDEPMSGVAFSPDGKLLAVGHEGGKITVWELAGKVCFRSLRGHVGSVDTVHFTPDGKGLVSTSRDGMLRLWDLEKGTSLDTITLGVPHWGVRCDVDPSRKYALYSGCGHRTPFLLRLPWGGR